MNTLIIPQGMLGHFEGESLIDSMLRAVGEKYSEDKDAEWAGKYGTNYENELFAMCKFCWCEKEDCKVCNGELPNFHYKPLDFKLSWYKYIGRGVEMNKTLTQTEILEMANTLLKEKELEK